MKKNSSTVYQGYKIRRQNKPDDLLTDSNFGTPLGEYMRCFGSRSHLQHKLHVYQKN